jgi:phospholipid-transporting ATPase
LDPFLLSLYNVVFTSAPILILGVFDFDIDPKTALQFPEIYSSGIENQFVKLFFFI